MVIAQYIEPFSEPRILSIKYELQIFLNFNFFLNLVLEEKELLITSRNNYHFKLLLKFKTLTA